MFVRSDPSLSRAFARVRRSPLFGLNAADSASFFRAGKNRLTIELFRKQSPLDANGLCFCSALLIPVFVPRPRVTAQTRRPAPLMRAARASAARLERVPHLAAGAEKIFGRAAVGARPEARLARRPAAARAANPLFAAFFLFLFDSSDDFFDRGRFAVGRKNSKNQISPPARMNFLLHGFKSWAAVSRRVDRARSRSEIDDVRPLPPTKTFLSRKMTQSNRRA